MASSSAPSRKERGFAAVLAAQLIALSHKNLRVLLGRPVVSLTMVFLPVLFILALNGLLKSLDAPSTAPRPLALETCSAFDVHGQVEPGTPCVTILYSPSAAAAAAAGLPPSAMDGDGTYGDAIMARLAAAHGMLWDGGALAGAAAAGQTWAAAVGGRRVDVVGAASSMEAGRLLYHSLTPKGVQIDAVVSFDSPFNGSVTAMNASWPTGNVSADGRNASLPYWAFGLGSATRGPAAGQVSYTIWANTSRLETYARKGRDEVYRATGHPGRLLALQAAVDGAVVGEATARLQADKARREGGSSSPSSSLPLPSDPMFKLNLGAFTEFVPSAGGTLGAGGVFTPAQVAFVFAGTTFPVLGVVLASLLMLLLVAAEKSARLVAHLRSVGLLESAYWASWWVGSTPVWLAMALITPAVARAVELPVWSDAEYGIHVLALFLFGCACAALSLAVGSCVRSPRPVNILAFLVFALALGLTMFSSILNIYTSLYSPSFAAGATGFLSLFPWVHYGRVMGAVQQWKIEGLQKEIEAAAAEGTSGFGTGTGMGDVTGTGNGTVTGAGNGTDTGSYTSADSSTGTSSSIYGWEELTRTPPSQTAIVRGLPVTWTDRNTAFSLAMLVVDSLGWLLVAWYCGQVLTGDLGAALPWYFPLDPGYWRGRPKRQGQGGGSSSGGTSDDPTDTLARLQAASASSGGLVTHKLSKSYGKTTALKEVSLGLVPGELLALLGQNGAGKTTLVNVLTGIIAPTNGEAFLCGQNLRTEVSSGLRDSIGSCPQDDLLWDALSARDHVHLFARFKGVPSSSLHAHCESMLAQVDLLTVADQLVGTFSGGMKRRLSIAMAAVGDPRILFLDEPGSGLDPLSRRQVWRIIQGLKPGRPVVLTTHDMSEADALGDTVAILAGGRLRALGSPLFLKSRFGRGYAVSLLVDPAKMAEAKALISSYLPGAEIIGAEEAAGAGDGSGHTGTVQAEGLGMLQLAGAPRPATGTAAVNTPASTTDKPGRKPFLQIRVFSGGKASSSTSTSAATGGGSGGSLWPAPPSTSGSLTVSIPRSMLPLLPSFLRALQAHSWGGTATAGDQGGAGAGAAAAADAATTTAPSTSTSSPLVREWGVSNSSLEEVFLRLAAADSALNAPLGDAAGTGTAAAGAAVADAGAISLSHLMGPQAGGAGGAATAGDSGAAAPAPTALTAAPGPGRYVSHATGRVCALCESAVAVPTTVFTSASLEVTAPDLLCASCGSRSEEQVDQARVAGGRPPVFAGRVKTKPTAVMAAGKAAQPADGDTTDSTAAMPAKVGPVSFEPAPVGAAEGAAAASGVSAIGAAADERGIAALSSSHRSDVSGGSSVAGEGDVSTAMVAVSESSSGSGSSEHVEGGTKGQRAEVVAVSAATPGAVYDSSSEPVASKKLPPVVLPPPMPRPMVQPVPFLAQADAVFALRWQLQAKARWASCCQVCLVLIAVAITLVVVPNPAPPGRYCPDTGFYSANKSLGQGSPLNTPGPTQVSGWGMTLNSFFGSQPVMLAPSDQDLCSREAFAGWAGKARERTAERARTLMASEFREGSQVRRTHAQSCVTKLPNGDCALPYTVSFNYNALQHLVFARLPDWEQAIIWPTVGMSGSDVDNRRAATLWYADTDPAGPADGHVPLRLWDLVGAGLPASLPGSTRRYSYERNATAAGFYSGTANSLNRNNGLQPYLGRVSPSPTPSRSPGASATRTASPSASPAPFAQYADWLPGAVRWVDRGSAAAAGSGQPGYLPYPSRTDASMDADVTEAQRLIFTHAQPLNGTCRRGGIGTGSGGAGSRLAWQWEDALALQEWTSAHLPSAAVAVTRARPGSPNPSLHYTLRSFALASPMGASYSPYRQSAYPWLRGLALSYPFSFLQTGPYDPVTRTSPERVATRQECAPFSPALPTDDMWSSVNNPAPAPVLLSAVHNALFRSAVETQELWSEPVNGSAAMQASIAAGARMRLPALPREAPVSIRTAFAHMPSVSWIPDGNVAGAKDPIALMYGGLVWPLFTLTLLPTLAYPIATEKAGRQYGAVRTASMRAGAYFAGHYAWAFTFTAVQLIIFIAAGAGVGSSFFTTPHPGLWTALVLVWSHAQAGWAVLLGALVPSPRLTSMVGYLLLIVISLGHFLLLTFAEPLPTGMAWWPLFSYARASFLVLVYGGQSVNGASELGQALIATFLEGAAALALGMYLHAVVPGPDGAWAPVSPVEPLVALARCVKARMRRKGRGEGGSGGAHGNSRSKGAVVGEDVLLEDEMAAAAHASALADPASHAFALHLTGLVKCFPSRAPPALPNLASLRVKAREEGVAAAALYLLSCLADQALTALFPSSLAIVGSEWSPHAKRAVDGLSLCVPYGETLGLLGPNGAGKTTTLAVLTGGTPLTAGHAHVAGWDVSHDRDRVWRVLSVCPQFDVVFDELTVAEHLLFYCKMKGLTRGLDKRRVAAMVRTAAERVELDGDAFTLAARELSGGMRRRLSIAIALLGDPPVVLLDEPTTGLDPETKRHIHRIIAAQKAVSGRSIVITTHGMDEADALCSRIAILAGGRLRAVGTQHALKARYGKGYRLTVTLPLGRAEAGAGAGAGVGAADPYAGPAAALHAWLCRDLVSIVQAATAGAAGPVLPLPPPELLGRVGATASYLLPLHAPAATAAGDDGHGHDGQQTQGAWDLPATFAALESLKRQGEKRQGDTAGSASAVGSATPGAPLLLDFGLAQTSLDEVFVAVVEAAAASASGPPAGTGAPSGPAAIKAQA